MSTDKDAEKSEAFDPQQWVDRHGDALFRFAVSRLGDRQVAEDIVQETFLAAWQARDSFAGRSSEQTWLIGILRRKVADHFRRTTRRETAEVQGAVKEEAIAIFDRNGIWVTGPRRWHLDPSAIAEIAEFWRVFDHCIQRLPPAVAEAYCLREEMQMSSDEICQLLDITATNLWTKLYRARMLLRRCVERNWFESTR